jgi:7-cyano-7-deazaguanine synthase in queuosine biosynthesis
LDVTAKKFANGYSCLFSAGLDSYVGVLDAKRKFGIVRAVFTKHKDQGAIYTLAQRLMGSMGRIDFKTVEAPEHKSRTRLARGVLYILYAFLLKERNVIVSEVGPTMYQPRFTLLDDVAITTHPYILRFSKIIAEAVLETKLTIVKPNENLTKAELASIGSDMEWLGDTCSCRRTRFAASAIPNCGVCFACVVRRLALMVAGVPKNVYWSDWSHERKRIDNIVHLIRFSIDYLTSPESIQRFTVDDIERYRKEDVFRRFALDNLAGLHLMMKHGEHLAQALQKLLDLGMETVSVESIENRIEEVRARTRSPDYGNIL